MAGEPMRPALLTLAVLAMAGCTDDTTSSSTLEVPSGVAVLQDGDTSPFEEPIGYVASEHGGRIVMLALKQGRYLTDDPTASFLRAAWLPTGEARLLADVEVWAPELGTIDVFAADKATERLLRVPHVVSLDEAGRPVEYPPSHDAPTLVDVDGSGGDTATLTEIEVKHGYTTTELWTAEYDGEVWWVRGSRSGVQEDPATPDEHWVASERAVAFTVTGTATAGDQLTLQTHSGVVEYDVGGMPLELAMAPDQSTLAAVVHDRELDAAVVRLIDPATGLVTDTLALAEDSEPLRLAWEGSTLFVADGGHPAVWEVTDATPVEIPLPWPVLDVAPLRDGDDAWLHVAPLSGWYVYVYDRNAGALVDVVPSTPEVDGLRMTAPVRGLEAIPHDFPWPEVDNGGVNLAGKAVAISLYSGRIVFGEAGTGCLIRDEYGPRTSPGQYGSLDYSTSYTSSSGPWLEENETNDRHVQVSACGGLALPEGWTLRYSEALQAWEVEGSTSGPQERLAYEDQRYMTDGGELSFTIRAGTTPSQDGWTIELSVAQGLLQANGDNDGDGSISADEPHMDLPGDPTYFWYEVGPTGGGWDTVDSRPFVLFADEGANLAGRVEPPTGEVEVVWD